MKLHLYEVIQDPVVTEKITKQAELYSKYAFRVHPSANKKQVRSAVEKIFNVHVTKINVLTNLGKWRRIRHQPGRTSDWKKAIVTLKKGEKIDITTTA